MATPRLVASLALISACVRNDPDIYTTFPEPIEVAGPPGGEMDREWQSGSSGDAYAEDPDASLEVAVTGELTATCSDAEIDATLAGYGEWIETDGYGRVWRPYTTAVGVDFTPYETCGSWVWTEDGWTFACEWDWGWLPFHYGRWGWFDDYWAWVPGYDYSPAWVEWRSGGGYVGWRPLAPIVRDHRSTHAGSGGGVVIRDHRSGPIVRDHRHGPRVRDHRARVAAQRDWQWRFTATDRFGKPRIRAQLDKSLAERLRVTRAVARPPVRATVQPVRTESILRARLSFAERVRDARARARAEAAPPHADWRDPRVGGRVGGRVDIAPVGGATRGERPVRRHDAAFDRSPTVYQPSWPSRQPSQPSLGTATPPVAPPSHGSIATTATPEPSPAPTTQHPLAVPDRYTPTMGTPTMGTPPAQPPVYQPPPRMPERYTAPAPTTRAPDRASPPTYSPPSRSSAPTYSPPSRSSAPTYSPPSRSSAPTYSPPARSAPTYSPPAAPSGGQSGAARSHRR